MAEREGLGIVEALFLRGGFLIPQIFPLPFAFPSHYCELHFYHSSHSRSSEMDLSRHKSHPVFSSLRLSLLYSCLLSVSIRGGLCMRKILLMGGMDLKDICIKPCDRMGGILSKTLLALNRLQRCCIGGILLYSAFLFSLTLLFGLRGQGIELLQASAGQTYLASQANHRFCADMDGVLALQKHI
jgi:hypothetical protein